MYCHEVMIRGLSERSEAVRSTAAAGLSVIYDMCTDSLRKSLLPRLTASLGQRSLALPRSLASATASAEDAYEAKEELARSRAAQEPPPPLAVSPMDGDFSAAAGRA